MQVSDINLISFSIEVGGGVFAKGHTIALFHFEGTNPSLIELLKMAHKGVQEWVLNHEASKPVCRLALLLCLV